MAGSNETKFIKYLAHNSPALTGGYKCCCDDYNYVTSWQCCADHPLLGLNIPPLSASNLTVGSFQIPSLAPI